MAARSNEALSLLDSWFPTFKTIEEEDKEDEDYSSVMRKPQFYFHN
jgi:hypothetical protein